MIIGDIGNVVDQVKDYLVGISRFGNAGFLGRSIRSRQERVGDC